MKKIISITLLLIAIQANAQNTIEWDGKYQLQLSDFQSNATQIGNVKINEKISNELIYKAFKNYKTD